MIILSIMIFIVAIALTSSQQVLSTESMALKAEDGRTINTVDSKISSLPAESDITETGLSPIIITRLTSIVFLISGALSYNALYIQSIGSGISIYSGLFQITVLSQSFDLFIFILASLILIPWVKSINMRNIKDSVSYITGPIVSEYSLILLFSTLGSSLLLSSGNLLSMYLSVELQSFGVYILATIYRNSESSTSAGLKYFLLGGLSSCLILLGCVLIYSYTGLIHFEDIYSLITAGGSIDSNVTGLSALHVVLSHPSLELGLILIFIGFLFKIAASPFHNWAPDVYNDVPTIVTTWLSIMPKIAIIVLSFEIMSTINLDYISLWESGTGLVSLNSTTSLKTLLLLSSFLSLIIGTVVGLAQIKIKRLLAYSTISHVGFLLMALSINTEESLESLLFYLIQYSFTNLNTFFILLSFGYILHNATLRGSAIVNKDSHSNKDISLISELKGQFRSNPLLSLSLSVSLFSMAGIPPLLGFFAKAQILYAATQNGYYFISLVAIVVSVISAYYYLQIIKVMHFDSDSVSAISVASEEETVSYYGISNVHSYIISVLTLSLLLFILNPSILLNSVHLLALNIFYS